MARPYRANQTRMLNKEVDVDSDALVWTLHTASYTPNADTHANVSDLTNELGTGGGYTAGGLAIVSPARTFTVANSWGTARANSTTYAVDDVVRPATPNGFLYRCAVAGTSGGASPAFSTTLGRETADNTVVWTTVGSGITVFGCTDPTWPGATFGPCRYAVLSDRTAGAAASQPLICYVDFGSDRSGGGGNFVVNLHPALRALHWFMP